MIKRTTKHFLHIAYYIGLVLIASIAMGWVWLALDERELKDFPVWMREVLLPSDSGYMLDADAVSLKMAGFSGLIEIHMDQARFLKNGEDVFISFPEIIAAWDVKHLLLGRVVLDYVLFKKPELWAGRDMSGHISIKTSEADADESIWPVLAAWLGDDEASFSFPQIRRLFLREASLTLKDERTGSLWQAPLADMELERDRFGHVTASIMAKVETSIGDKKLPASEFDAKMLYDAGSKKLEGEFNVKNISPKSIAALDPSLVALEGLDIILDAHAFLMKEFESGGNELKILFTGDKGRISMPQYLPEDQQIKKLAAMVRFTDNGNNIELSSLEVETSNLKISGQAKALRQDDVLNISAEGSLSDLPINELKNYWKDSLFPEGRKWVMDHISGGTIPDASAKVELTINTTSGDFALKDAEATVAVNGARVAYYEDLTPVDDVHGVLTLKPNLLSIDMQSGHIGNMHLKHGTLSLPDMTAYETWIDINLEVAGDALDAVKYMQNKMFAVFMKPVNIMPDGTSGEAAAKIYFKVPIGGPEKDPREFQYDINADLKNGAAPAVMGTMQASDANLSMQVNNQELKLKGEMKLFGYPAEIDMTDRYKKAGVQDTDYSLNMLTDIESLKKIGIILPDIFKGQFRMVSKVRMDGKAESATHDLDLKDAEIDLGYFAYKKPRGKAGSLHFETKNITGSSLIEVHKFDMVADDVKASGNLKLDVKKGRLEELSMPSARFGKNDINVKFSRSHNDDSSNVVAVISGKSLDISELYGQEQIFGGHEPWPDIDASIDVATLAFGAGRELKSVKGHLKCSDGECRDGKLNASYIAGGGIEYNLGHQNGLRSISIKTGNMGELARVLDITDNIVGGDMDIAGVFEDEKDGRPLKGLMKSGPYSTVRAPVLAKLLNLASFSGVGELLEGKGIGFDKMTLPFVMKDGVINIHDGKTIGGSLGVTIGGNIDTNSKHLKLEGTMVPSYGINSLPSAIPIIGYILVGGEGGGIFGVNYSVTGAYSDPKVSVNPLSLLTPGFLRGIFGSAETEPEPVPANE